VQWTQGGPNYYPGAPAAGGFGTPAYPPQPAAIRWDLAWRGALFCGVGAAILTAIPVVSLGCCLWMLGAGALSVSFYQKRVPDTLITPGMGMKLGALAGVFAFVVNAVLSTISLVTLRTSGGFRHAMEEQMQRQMSSTPDPKVQEMMQHMLDWMNTPQGAATMIVFFLLIMAAAFVIFTGAGGALGASLFGRRREFR
jgi:hypothetical protein